MRGRAVSEAGAPTVGSTQAPSIGLKGEQLGPSPQPLKITLQGVQLCIANAERLLKDSNSVSEPTAFALAELALEETLKGWVLYYHQRTENARRIVAGRKDTVVAYTRDLAEVMRRVTDVDVEKLFSVHQEKLKVLEPILKQAANALSGVNATTLRQLAIASAPGFTLMKTPSEADIRTLTESFDGAIDYLRKFGAAGLRQLAMSGFYVDRTDSGEIISPSCSSIIPAYPIRNITLALLGVLRSSVLKASGAPPPGRGRKDGVRPSVSAGGDR